MNINHSSSHQNYRNRQPLTLAGHGHHLGYWLIIRTFVLVILWATIAICVWQNLINLPFNEIILALAVLTGVNLLTYFRLRQQLPVTAIEFFIQLLIDLACLSTIFYFSGGANNPFVSYFLVPICIAAATLGSNLSLSITTLGILSYSLLLFFNVPLPALEPHQGHGQHNVNLHVMGMWLNFFISAGLISYFIVKMARDIRLQEMQLNHWREDQLRNEQVMAVATLAAGTAHELGTPLSSMKILLDELREECPPHSQLQHDLSLLQDQVNYCTTILRKLIATAEQSKVGEHPTETVRVYCRNLIESWQLVRPDVTAEINLSENNSIECQFHPTIAQAILNLLNNAADANPDHVQVDIFWDTEKLYWTIADNGTGIDDAIRLQIGKTQVSTKHNGLGIGLLLTQATINRYGGEVRLYNRVNGGAITELILPLYSAHYCEPKL